VKLLLKLSSADVNARGRDGWTALHLALRRPCNTARARTRMKDLLTVLIDAGADVNAECSRADGSKVRTLFTVIFFFLSKNIAKSCYKYDWTPLTYHTYVCLL
jgi:ankyrin repeat protein